MVDLGRRNNKIYIIIVIVIAKMYRNLLAFQQIIKWAIFWTYVYIRKEDCITSLPLMYSLVVQAHNCNVVENSICKVLCAKFQDWRLISVDVIEDCKVGYLCSILYSF